MKVNENFSALGRDYLFSEVAARVAAFERLHPDAPVLRMGVGDATLPLAPCVVDAMRAAAGEQAEKSTFRGYPPAQGYAFLREAVSAYYSSFGVDVCPSDVFISDGAKSDLGGVFDLLERGQKILLVTPTYPVYADVGRLYGHKIEYLCADESNGFLPMPQEGVNADVVVLCSPANPTGAAYTAGQLGVWVDYVKRQGALLIFDGAYEAFAGAGKARSVYEVDGAKDCAVEICSLSKTAGFTGVRCGYTVFPETLAVGGVKLKPLWVRRCAVRFNGVSYVTQRGAEAAFSGNGLAHAKKNVDYYKGNAKIIADALTGLGIFCAEAGNSPYVWMQCPHGRNGWEFFDFLLENARVVGTPGAGFGAGGERFFRFSAFCSREDAACACAAIKKVLS